MPAKVLAREARIAAARHQPLVVVLAAVAAGVVADRYATINLAIWCSLAGGAWLAWLMAWRRGLNRASAIALLTAAAAIGGAWHHCRWSLFLDDDVVRFARSASRPAAMEVRVASAPRFMPAPPRDPLRTVPIPDRTRIEVQITALRDWRDWRPASGLALLVVDGELANVGAGDRLRIFGQLSAARPPDNPGEFDFAANARADRRQCSLRAEVPDCVTRLAVGTSWSGRAWIDRLRGRGQRLLHDFVGERHAGLAAAMFLGIREELQPEESQAFLETGTIHLLVVSGLNVGILAFTLALLIRLGLLPRAPALAAIALLAILYALVTDSQPPVVRATVMVLVACGAQLAGRKALEFNSLAAAALVVLAINPSDLFRTGPQLSFLAVAVLCWLSMENLHRPPLDPLDRLIAATRPWPERVARWCGHELWRTLVASSLIWLIVSPLVMARFHLLSPAAVVLGPFLSIPVTLAMGTGFCILATGAWLAPLAQVCGYMCDGCLGVLSWFVALGQHLPGSHQWLPGPADWWLAGFYLVLAVWICLPRRLAKRRWLLAACCGWAAVGLGVGWFERARQADLVCTVLSVGHGSAVVLELPDGRTLLYDAGRLGSPDAASRAIASFLWSRGRTHLDAVVLSHADADHYNALPGTGPPKQHTPRHPLPPTCRIITCRHGNL